MATLHIEHAITDLTTWTAAFDRFAARRAAAGVTGTRIHRPVDDERYVVVQLDFPSVEAASGFREFLRSDVWSSPTSSPGLAGSPRALVLAAIPHSTP